MVKHRRHLTSLGGVRKGFLEERVFELYPEATYVGGGGVRSAKELW